MTFPFQFAAYLSNAIVNWRENTAKIKSSHLSSLVDDCNQDADVIYRQSRHCLSFFCQRLSWRTQTQTSVLFKQNSLADFY